MIKYFKIITIFFLINTSFSQNSEKEVKQLLLNVAQNRDLTISQKLLLIDLDNKINTNGLRSVFISMQNVYPEKIPTFSFNNTSILFSDKNRFNHFKYNFKNNINYAENKRKESFIVSSNLFMAKELFQLISNNKIANTFLNLSNLEYQDVENKIFKSIINFEQNNASSIFKIGTTEEELRKFLKKDFNEENINELGEIFSKNILDNPKFKNLTIKQKIEFIENRQNTFVNYVDEAVTDLKKVNIQTKSDIKKNKNNIDILIKLIDNQNSLIKSSNKELKYNDKLLSQNIDLLSHKYDSISKLTIKNKNDISILKTEVDYVKNSLFSNLSNREKYNWIKNNFYKIQDKKRTKILDSIKNEISREDKIEFHNSISNKIDIINSTVNILSKSKIIDHKTAKKINKSINKINELNNISKFYFSNQYGAMLNSASSLLFGNGSDNGLERHKEIMGLLGNMDVKLNSILSNQRKILLKLDNLDKKLDSLNIKNQERFIQLKYDIEYLSLDVNRLIEFTAFKYKWESLSDISNLVYTENYLTLKGNSLSSVTDAESKFNRIYTNSNNPEYNYPIYYLVCWELTKPNYEVASFTTFKDSLNQRVINFQENYLEKYYDISKNKFSINSFYDFHYTPIVNLDVYNKILNNQLKTNDNNYPLIESKVPFSKLIDVVSLLQLAEITIKFNEIMLLWDKNGHFYENPTDILKDKERINKINVSINRSIETLEKWVNLAIAQQNSICGSYLLEKASENCDSKEFQKLFDLSYIFRINTLNYFIYKSLKNNNKSFLSYHIAYNSNDEKNLREILQLNPNIHLKKINGIWHTNYSFNDNANYIPLPSINEVKHQSFKMTNDMDILIELRNRILDKKSEIQLNKDKNISNTQLTQYSLFKLTTKSNKISQ